MNPNLAKFAQIQSLRSAGKPEAALAMLQRMAAKEPANPDINTLLSLTLMELERPEQALFYSRRAADADPSDPVKLTNLAIVLLACRKYDEGVALCRKVLELRPGHTEARLALMNRLLDTKDKAQAAVLGREGLALSAGAHAPFCITHAAALIAAKANEEAEAFTREAMTRFPNESKLCLSYASALTAMKETQEAIIFLREARRRFPMEYNLAGVMALNMNATYGADPAEIARVHREYGESINRSKPAFRSRYAPTKDPSRKLRIGLVSPDLRLQSVAFFIESYLEQFDRTEFDVICYSTSRTFDAVSARLKSHATAWRDAAGLTDLQLAAQLSEDQIDIAIDLAGHTKGNSLPAFALRMAPVQVTYLGYPDTTGLTQMDYRIVDSYTDPRDSAVDARASEKLVRLDPCFLCYRPPPNAPEPIRNSQSAIHNPVFGSFNATHKHNPALIALWGRIMSRVPGSKMIIKSFELGDAGILERLQARFAAAGLGPDQVEFLKPADAIDEHLRIYNRIDVALDPFPYNGTTTTCEALWMSVPVVALAGRTHAGRVGVSLLTNLGLPELIAKDENEYVEIAVKLASDPARLAGYRASLRQRVAASPLCDGPGFSRRFEGALRAAWVQYCGA